jgi:hypothetical protein
VTHEPGDCGARQRPSLRLNKRACAALGSIALLVSPALGSATEIDASSFRCLTKMTPVRQFYVDNLLGDVAATLAAAVPRMPRRSNNWTHC